MSLSLCSRDVAHDPPEVGDQKWTEREREREVESEGVLLTMRQFDLSFEKSGSVSEASSLARP